jgi:tetratricopeptide (TPR) repeat protein
MLDLLSLWNFDDPAASEARFCSLAETLPADSDDRLETETQRARAIGLQRRFDEAHAVLDAVERAMATPAAAEPRRPRVRVRFLLERGRVLNSSGHPDRAKPLFVEAFDAATAAGEDALAVDAAHMVAIAEPAPEPQMAWNERALALAMASPDPVARRWRASLLNNMGWTRHGEGAYEAALGLFEQALEAQLEKGDAGLVRVARWSIARCLRSLGRFDEALAAQREIAEDLVAAGEDDGFVEEELAECLLALGQSGAAKPHFARAATLLGGDAWFVANEVARLERLRMLAG